MTGRVGKTRRDDADDDGKAAGRVTRAGKIMLGLVVVMLAVGAVFVRFSDRTSTTSFSLGSSDAITWPTSGLAAMLPTPPVTNRGDIGYEHDNTTVLDIDLYGVSAEQYAQYAEDCRAAGFDVDAVTGNKSYSAYDDEGYHLKLTYYTSHDGELDITLNDPVEYSDLAWPSVGLATHVPEPQSTRGYIAADRSSFYSAAVADTTIEEYAAYVDACMDAGFTLDYSRGDGSFYGTDADGYTVRVNYLGYNVMNVVVEAPDESDSAD